MSVYQGSFDKQIPGLRFIDRSAEGFLDIVYDNCFDPTALLYDCGPYVLTITKDGAPYGSPINVKNHFYESCWWLDLTPVDASSIIRQPAELIANGYVPPLGKTNIPLPPPSFGKDIFPGIMKLTPDVTGAEGTTGGRPEIGIVTTNAEEWLVLDDARDMLEDAKDVQTQPIWNYDNSKPIDLIAKPKATRNGAQAGGLQLGPYPAAPTAPGATLQLSIPDTAHMADECGVVALATGAPRYIRALQMRTVRGFTEDAYWALQWGQVTVWNGQGRGIAWLLRELFFCYWATLLAEQAKNLPSDCLPSSTFKTIIDNQVTLFTKYVEPTPGFKNLAVFTYAGAPNGDIIAWWQHDMINQVLGLYAQKWPAVWGPIYIKVLRNLAARVNADGLNQWPVAMPSWYWGLVSVHGAWYSSYKELWQKWSAGQASGVDTSGNAYPWVNAAQVAALNADPTNGGKFITPSQYESWTYGALAFAVDLDRGVLNGAVSAAYPRLEQAFTDFNAMMLNGYQYFIAPCSFSVTPQPPSTIPAPPPVTPPPVITPPPPPVPVPPAPLPATIPGIATRVKKLKTIVGVP